MSINNTRNDNDIKYEILNHKIPDEIECSARVRVKNVKDLKIYCNFINNLFEKFSYISGYRNLISLLLNVSESRIKEWMRIYNSSLKSNSNIVNDAFNNNETTLHDLVNSLKLTNKNQKRKKSSKSSSKKNSKSYIDEEHYTDNNNELINSNDNVTDNSNQSTEIDQEEDLLSSSSSLFNNDHYKAEINNNFYEPYYDEYDNNFKDNNINIDNIDNTDNTDSINEYNDYNDDNILTPLPKRFRDIDFISFTPDLLLGFHEDDSPISVKKLFSQIEEESHKFEHIWSESDAD